MSATSVAPERSGGAAVLAALILAAIAIVAVLTIDPAKFYVADREVAGAGNAVRSEA